MENRYRDKLNTIIVAANFNRIFRSTYSDFEKKIFLKIKNKDPVHESLMDMALSGCVPKPTYFLGATVYMRVELTMEHVQDLRDTIFSQLFPIIKNMTPEMMSLMVKSILEALAIKILHMDIVNFEDLKNISYRDILMESKSFMKEWDKQEPGVQLILRTLPQMRDQFLHEYAEYVENLIHSKAGLWKIQNLPQKEYEREIECEFVLSAIKLK